MTSKTYQIFNTKDDDGNDHRYIFDTYLDGDLPDDLGGCIYIFANMKSSGDKYTDYHHIHYIDRLRDIIDKTNILALLFG